MILILDGHSLTLLPDKAVLLEDRTLVVADLHLGKATAFQAHGLPVPEGDSAADLHRLALLCRRHDARRVVVNGDLFHSPAGLSPAISALLAGWLEQLDIPVELVVGNHDAKLPKLPPGLQAVSRSEHAGFSIVHDPAEALPDQRTLTAHWHPVARITDGRQRSLRLPCYFLRGRMLVLPSFGGFTGGAYVKPQPGDRCFVSPAGTVMEIPLELVR